MNKWINVKTWALSFRKFTLKQVFTIISKPNKLKHNEANSIFFIFISLFIFNWNLFCYYYFFCWCWMIHIQILWVFIWLFHFERNENFANKSYSHLHNDLNFNACLEKKLLLEFSSFKESIWIYFLFLFLFYHQKLISWVKFWLVYLFASFFLFRKEQR